MKTLLTFIGVAAGLFLSGCARDHVKAATNTTNQPPLAQTAPFTATATGTPALYYQWYFNGTNSGVTNR